MFGRRSRKHTEALEELREEFSAADRHARAALADAMAQIELRMARERDDGEATRLATEAAVENAQAMLTAQTMEVGRLLQQVANTCALVVERVEADRAERIAFAEAIGRALQGPGAPHAEGEHPLGGTVYPAPEIAQPAEPGTDEREIDLRASAEPVAEPDDARPAAPEPAIDLRTPDDRTRGSRPIPRWARRI